MNAARLRTLPLALASVGMGVFLAYSQCDAIPAIGPVLIFITTVLLQILSNFANDYGDYVHGADHAGRVGPDRMVQSGEISPAAMLMGIRIVALLSLLSGGALLYTVAGLTPKAFIFFAIGLTAIWAAYHYTAGNRPYGYAGLGDVFVFVFFGMVGVVGAYLVLCYEMVPTILLPAISVGLLATGVLNLNNIRDINSDISAGKKTIPVRIGLAAAKKYHLFLLFGSVSSSILYVVLNYKSPFQFVFLLVLPLIYLNAKAVIRLPGDNLRSIDPYLKQLAFTTLFFVLFFGIGNLFSQI